jgi:nitrite reductase/ring-hydroxylating ferredoxin subunit
VGLRDLIKGKVKAALGRPPSPSPAAVRATDGSLPGPTDGWTAVARASQVPEGKAGTFPHANAVVAIFRKDGKLYAMDNACAHEDGPVGEGAIAGCRVKCPYHDWEYDYTTGACITDPTRALGTWSVRERDGFLWIGPRLTEGTGERGGDHNDGMETIIR